MFLNLNSKINNAGVGHKENFIADPKIEDMLNLNMITFTKLLRRFIPHMIK